MPATQDERCNQRHMETGQTTDDTQPKCGTSGIHHVIVVLLLFVVPGTEW